MKLLKICLGSAVAGTLIVSGAGSAAMAAPMAQRSAAVGHLETLGWSPSDDIVERSRWRHRHDRGIDGGDILAGVLIIGGIAAIASAASNKANERRYPRNDPYRDNRRHYDSRYSSDELNEAADQCAFAAEERVGLGAQVDRITSVARDGTGWQVAGSVSFDGGYEDFLCGVSNGRIDYIQLGR